MPGQERPHGSGVKVLREVAELGSGAGEARRRSDHLTHLAPILHRAGTQGSPLWNIRNPRVLVKSRFQASSLETEIQFFGAKASAF